MSSASRHKELCHYTGMQSNQPVYRFKLDNKGPKKQGQVLFISFSIPFSPCVKLTLKNRGGKSTRLFYNALSSGQCGV